MLRLTEILLFLSPLILAAIWWFAGRRMAVVALPALALAAILATGLIIYGVRRSMPRGATYVPARIEGGRIVDGHAQ